MTEDEMVGWHHQHNVNESEKNPEDNSAEQGILLPSTGSQKVRQN